MTKRLNDRVAIVTGGASGIGLATSRRLLSEGARVVIADMNAQATESALKQFAEEGYQAHCDAVLGDVSDETQVAELVAHAVKQFGGLDIAFLNAGIGGAFGSIRDLQVSHWDETFSMLVRSVFLGIRFSADAMKARGGGIIATSSVARLSGGAGGHPYSAAKAAVVNLVRTSAVELAPDRIRVNSVAPGLISTPLVHRGDESRIPPTTRQQPWPDLGHPDHLAGVVAFLASDDAGFVTGQTIAVDGGLMANGANLWETNLYTGGLSGMNRGSTGKKPTINN